MNYDPERRSVLAHLHAAQPVFRETSLATAATALRRGGAGIVAVIEGPFVIGVLREDSLRAALLAGESPLASVAPLVDPNPPIVPPSASVEEARAKLLESGLPALVITDSEGRYLGVVSASDLILRPPAPIRPGLIGGLATPFGVYLTNGEVAAGAGPLALTLTGALLFVLFAAGIAGAVGVVSLLGFITGDASLNAQTALTGTNKPWVNALVEYLPVVLFLLFVRLAPLAGTHGAEHMVVHAIEREEPLEVEVVARMPRVHPRCGTNIAVGAMLFLFLVATFRPLGEAGLLFAFALTALSWRQIGALAQLVATTKQPSRRQLEAAVSVGRELLSNFQRTGRVGRTFGKRLMHSGLPWLLLGSLGMSLLSYLIGLIFGLPILLI
ncbi:MAG: DUF1385 domain-containing protein [Armatimonadetes bacterium]|nr:DUF1385 domain-containing protein [Armatimonadota bacterium]